MIDLIDAEALILAIIYFIIIGIFFKVIILKFLNELKENNEETGDPI